MSKKEKLLASAQKSLQKGQLAKAIKDYQQILQIEPGDMRNRQKIAELLGRDRRTEEALGEYETVAKHYTKTGFYLKAIAVYKQMQKLDPSKVGIYHHLAELNEKQGLVGNALAEYRNLVAHYEKQKMYAEAASVLQKMRELEPENLNILVKIAETYAKDGLRDRAREEFDTALTILRQKGDFSRVLKLYEIFLPLYPDRPEMKVGMARALIEKGDAERGMQILKNLLHDDPEQPEILAVLTQGYRKLGDHDNERLTFQHLLRNAPEDLDLRQGYIRACIDSREPERALEELEGCKEDFLTAEKASVLQGFYEELKQLLPQNGQLSRSLQSLCANTGDEPHSADLSVLLGGLDSEAGDDPCATENDFASDPVRDAQETEEIQEVDSGLSGAAEEPIDSFSEAEEGEDLEIPLEFLEEVAVEDISGFEEPADSEPDEEESAGEEGEPFGEDALELELELEIDNDGEGLDIEPVADEREDVVPFDEDVLDLEIEDALAPEEFTEDAADAEEEILDLDMSDALMPDDAPDVSRTDLRSELEEAEFYLRQGLLEDAERICRSLLGEHPDNKDILTKLSEIENVRQAASPAPTGQLFDLEGELANEDLSVLVEGIDGFADSQKGIETTIDLEDTESHYNLGIAYKEMGLLDEAVAEFEKALHNPTRRVGCLTLKGICLVEKGSFEEAEDAFRAGMAHPGLGEGERISLLYELGLLFERWNKHLEALDSFQSVADADIFFRDVGEKVASLRKKLGMDAGEDEGEEGPKGDKNRVSYV